MGKSGINRMKFVRFLINEEDLGKPIEECKVLPTEEPIGQMIKM